MIPQEKNAYRKDFLIKINKRFRRIKLDDIYYLQSDGKYVTIYLESRRVNIRSSLKLLKPKLADNFVRVHSSYIVNTDKISNIQNVPSVLTLVNGIELAYSRKFKENIFSLFILG